MKILQLGYPKSGNFWLHQIIRKSMEAAKMEVPGYIVNQPIYQLAKEWDLNYPGQAAIDVIDITDLQVRYRISSIFQMPIENMENYTMQARHVWSHSPVCKRTPEILTHFTKILYIVRDPRDMVLSAAKYFCSPYMLKYFPQEETVPQKFLEKNFERLIEEWKWHVFDYLRLASQHEIHFVFYENFLHRFQQELDELLYYLEIVLDDDKRLELEEQLQFDQMKKENPGHLKTGKSGYWKDALTGEQIAHAQKSAGPLLALFGYDKEELPSLGSTSEIDFEELKENISRGFHR